MEFTAEQKQAYAEFNEQLARRMEAHHRIVNAQPRTTRDRIDRENQERISRWAERRKAELGITAMHGSQLAEARAILDQATAEAPASGTPAPEVSADASASTVVVKPGAKPAA